MEQLDDSALLRRYIESQSDEAFAALVTRHINLVYSVALRQTGNPESAEEIAQAVFIVLAKKAKELRHEKALSSWLFQATRLTAANLVRSESRRRDREQEAYMQSTSNDAPDETWVKIAPLLDSAVATLREKDRRAILMRFYEGRNLQEVGAALGASEDAAEKRVSRALDKLRHYFSRRGVNSTTAIISGQISANSVQVAPATLAKAVAAASLAKGATVSVSTLTLMKGGLKVMAWTKAKTAVAISVGVLLTTGAAVIVARQVVRHSDLMAMQGTWTGQEAGVRGSSSLVLQGTKLEFHGADTNEWYKATISLRGTISKQCMVTMTACADPEYVGKRSYAIYKIEGNTLTISANEPGTAAPPSFGAPGSRTVVFTKISSAGVVEASADVPAADTKAPDAMSVAEVQGSGSIADWGTVINPDGDCTVSAADGKLTMALPGNDHALRPERQKMNAPRVMQEIDGEFDIQVKVSGDFSSAPKSVVPGRPGYQDAGLLIWQDDKNNLKLSRARIAAQGRIVDYFNLEFRNDRQVGEIPLPREAGPLLRADTVYLRLQIHAAGTTVGVSSDGQKWITMSLRSSGLPEKLHAGILAENNTSAPFNAVFEGFTLSKSTGK